MPAPSFRNVWNSLKPNHLEPHELDDESWKSIGDRYLRFPPELAEDQAQFEEDRAQIQARRGRLDDIIFLCKYANCAAWRKLRRLQFMGTPSNLGHKLLLDEIVISTAIKGRGGSKGEAGRLVGGCKCQGGGGESEDKMAAESESETEFELSEAENFNVMMVEDKNADDKMAIESESATRSGMSGNEPDDEEEIDEEDADNGLRDIPSQGIFLKHTEQGQRRIHKAKPNGFIFQYQLSVCWWKTGLLRRLARHEVVFWGHLSDDTNKTPLSPTDLGTPEKVRRVFKVLLKNPWDDYSYIRHFGQTILILRKESSFQLADIRTLGENRSIRAIPNLVHRVEIQMNFWIKI
ncbi:hypothetical protein DL98DRAFT_539097 [Cadophora sp. DSE1049]|nr:hypothetical protein DL98DRAFT_539097 [Cadophora sp. DSE1049]